MKKLLGVSLCFVLLAMVLGPVFAGGRTQSGASGGGAQKEIFIFMEQGDIKDEEQADFFREYERTRGIKVNIINGGPDSQYRQNLAVAINGNQPLDVLLSNGQAVRGFVSKGLLDDLTDQVTYWDRFNDSAINQFTFNGKRYALAWGDTSTSGIFLNNDVLRKYNLSAPKNYDDLLRMRDALARDRIAVFGFGGGTIYMWPMWYFSTHNQTSGNRSIERTEAALRGQAKFTDKDFVDAMDIIGRMGRDGLFNIGFNGMETAQGYAVFTSGNAALFYGGTWCLSEFREAGMTGDKLGFVPFPIVVPGAKSEQTGDAGGPAFSILKNLSPERKQAAIDLMDYITDLRRSQAHWDKVERTQPKSLKGYDPGPNADVLVRQVIIPELVPNTVTFLDWIWPPEIVTAFQQQIQATAGGQTSAANAMAEIQRVFDNLVRSGYNFDATN
jgi:raffinose/stachyose/melibiose transport system substrate-binding protein